MTKKRYTAAPLPFQGQKRNFVKQFKEELSKRKPPTVYVDLFGGSGLLSRIAKDAHPESTVIYNDYDDFRQRLETIPKTNKLLQDLRVLIADIPYKKKINEVVKNKIITHIAQEKGYVDYITLSTNLLFNMRYAFSIEGLKKEGFYNRLRKSDIPTSNDYLNGLEVVKMDYKELFYKYKQHKNVVFLVDPPYLTTEIGMYNNMKYWKLRDYLEVLKVLIDQKYIYFTSNKSNIVELCEWIETNTGGMNPFDNATITTRETSLNYQSSYIDMMIVNWTETIT